MAEHRFEFVLAAAQAGEEWALETLYRQLQPALVGYLRSQRPADAEDLAAETWIAAARGLGRFRGDEDDFRRWIFTIARRRLIDLRRQDSRRPQTVPDTDAPEPIPAPDAASEAIESEEARRALERVASLPPAEAEVVVLRVIAGLSAADVAAITERTPGAVRVLQHRALRTLAEIFSKGLVTLSGPLSM